jgi:hypothetical protein
MTAFNQIADRYLASWNETDVARTPPTSTRR